MLWIEETALAGWQAERRTTPGGQRNWAPIGRNCIKSRAHRSEQKSTMPAGMIAAVQREDAGRRSHVDDSAAGQVQLARQRANSGTKRLDRGRFVWT